ncbi:MAG: bacterial Ig-like domain-containing protein, partial [Clostridia bacterium]|nr:bacterial Ig-like domain-containing protein [Clostridia bacterium]
MKKALATVLAVCLLASMLTVGMFTVLTAGAADGETTERQMKIQAYTSYYNEFLAGNTTEYTDSNGVTTTKQNIYLSQEKEGVVVYPDAALALPGTLFDPWEGGRENYETYDYNWEYTHRQLLDGDYLTFRLEVDKDAQFLEVNGVYASPNQGSNWFAIQMSTDGVNWKTAADYGNPQEPYGIGPIGLGKSWGMADLDQTSGRDQNNKDVMAAASVVDDKKIVYLRLVAQWNQGTADGSADAPYTKRSDAWGVGDLRYNNFFIDAKFDTDSDGVLDTTTRQAQVKTLTQYWLDHGTETEATGLDENGAEYPIYSEAQLALAGTDFDAWAGSRDTSVEGFDADDFIDHRQILDGEYMTLRLEVNKDAQFLELNGMYASPNQGSNWFGIQMSADGLNWKTVADYGNPQEPYGIGPIGFGKSWGMADLDQSSGRDQNNRDVMAACTVVDDKKVVYLRLVGQWNQGEMDGSADKPYVKSGSAWGVGDLRYNNFYIDVVVPAAVTLESIAVTTAPTKAVYELNTALDVTGGKLTLTYSDGSTKEVDMTADMVSGFDSATSGEKTLTVAYEDKTTTMAVTVNEKRITAVELVSAPAKTTYEGGEALDVTGGVLKVSYSDGSTENVDITAAMVTGFDADTAGEQTLTVTYGEKAVTYAVTVKEKPIVESYVVQINAGTGYEYDDDQIVESTEYSVNMDIFNNGETYRVQNGAEDYVLYKLDLDNYTTNLSYTHCWIYDMAAGFTVQLSKDGESFETWATKSSEGSSGSIGADQYTWNAAAVTNVLADNPEKIVYVKLQGAMKMNNIGFTVTTTINPSDLKDVASATVIGDYKKEYMLGDDLDINGMILHIVYTDGTEQDITVQSQMVSGWNGNELNDALTLTVSTGKAVATCTVAVKPIQGTKYEDIIIEVDGPYGFEIFEGEDLAAREKEFEDSAFTWETHVLPNRPTALKNSEMAVDHLLAYTLFPFSQFGNLDNPYMTVDGDGWITYELDLNDRATSFTIGGWGEYLSCNFYASKDGGETWYLVADLDEKSCSLGNNVSKCAISQELCAANIQKVLTGNPEKKIQLKVQNSSYGKVLFCNLILHVAYNVGDVEDLPLIDETLEAEKAAAAAVDALIEAIGEVEYTDACKAKIDAARAAYEELSAVEAPHVKKLFDLENAEETYASLAKTAANQAKADEVIALIEAIGEVEYTVECRDAIIAALDAYEALTNAQKRMVEN